MLNIKKRGKFIMIFRNFYYRFAIVAIALSIITSCRVQLVADYDEAAAESIIQAYKENPSHEAMAEKYHEAVLTKSEIFTKDHIGAIHLFMDWLSNGIKAGKLI